MVGRPNWPKFEEASSTGPSTEWYRLDVEAIQAQMPYELLPVYLLQSPLAEGNGNLPVRIETEIDLSEGPHLNYALQWFTFALIAGVIYLRIVYTKSREAAESTPPQNKNTMDLKEAYDGQDNPLSSMEQPVA